MSTAVSPVVEQRVSPALKHPRILVREVLAGLVVCLALIPEVVGFSIIAGLDPAVGLYTSMVMVLVISVSGGRPAMVTAAAGATALVLAQVSREYDMNYVVAAVLLAGVLQIVLALLGVGKLMRFIPRSVMTAFLNALAILIALSQLPHLVGVGWQVYALVALGILIVWLFPKLTKAIPAPLVAIVVVTAVALIFRIDVPTVADQGELPSSLPALFFPDIPWTLETLQIIGPTAIGIALVGLMESLMTAKLVDDITETNSSKTRESIGQGVANIAAGAFGGMGGCAMIGQTMINVKGSGARTRVSTFAAGIWLMLLILLLGDVVGMIPMAALVAVMIMVAIGTFNWHSIAPATLKRMPRAETFVMLLTVVVVVWTENLAIGVLVGVLAAMIAFARRVAHFTRVTREVEGEGEGAVARYKVSGPLFWASSNDLVTQFRYADDPGRVVIDMRDSHVWDASSVVTLDAIEQKYQQHDIEVEFVGMNAESRILHRRLRGTTPT
ncbi:SulP family inorganic anion transporter [Gulosibacter molinativorax]|uniref:SulP family inorganic anion transporter n=1 Tax=Gulosibacter molinativorax TaxID=256821 RepID=A0ABT7C702_9MICO|nr:SulP family inorganic anion transporter [Gulosibacter molinativorax]MDJ1370982.1 SulP family inorganic anion transporter [Gulosibacter molinativorax]QUY62773.1 Putative sulfate transporter YbaR [Gulosibacter molinativorax]